LFENFDEELNPKINLSAEAIVNYRSSKNIYTKQDYLFFGIGIRTGLFNRYTDY